MKHTAMIQLQKKKQRRVFTYLMGLSILLVLCSILYLSVGSTTYSLQEVVDVLLGKAQGSAGFTIGVLRLPRLWTGLLAGMALGAAGTTFQRLLRNPLASPDIIGVSSATSATALFCILFLQFSGPIVSFISIIAGLGIALLLFLCGKGSVFSNNRMILIGLGLQAMLTACISFMLLRANQHDVSAAMRWLSGSLTGMQMHNVYPLAIVIIIALTGLFLLQRPLSLMETGEELSITLGVPTGKIRALAILCAVVLIAFTTSLCGPIAFVSFLAGPIARQLNKGATPNLMMAALIGALLVVIGDFAAQNLVTTRYPVGVMTGILGAPYLLFLLIRMNKSGGVSS